MAIFVSKSLSHIHGYWSLVNTNSFNWAITDNWQFVMVHKLYVEYLYKVTAGFTASTYYGLLRVSWKHRMTFVPTPLAQSVNVTDAIKLVFFLVFSACHQQTMLSLGLQGADSQIFHNVSCGVSHTSRENASIVFLACHAFTKPCRFVVVI